jgi:hypothetical protein
MSFTLLSAASPTWPSSWATTNAYNTCDRAKGLESLYNEPTLSTMRRFMDCAYGKPSSLVARAVSGELRLLRSEQGWRQGCHSGTSNFARCTKGPVIAVRAEFPDVLTYTYMYAQRYICSRWAPRETLVPQLPNERPSVNVRGPINSHGLRLLISFDDVLCLIEGEMLEQERYDLIADDPKSASRPFIVDSMMQLRRSFKATAQDRKPIQFRRRESGRTAFSCSIDRSSGSSSVRFDRADSSRRSSRRTSD